MKRTLRLLVLGGLAATAALALTPNADAVLANGSYHCNLAGGNGIIVDFRLTEQGPPGTGFFALTGQWDDSSLTPFPADLRCGPHGSALQHRRGLHVRRVRENSPLPGSPFGSTPAGIHVQFQLDETRPGPALVDFFGRWADNLANFGKMVCTFIP